MELHAANSKIAIDPTFKMWGSWSAYGAIRGTYQGGHIRRGNQVGRVTGPNTIELLYQCLTTDGEILSGWSRGTVGVDHAGRTTLTFVWGWLSGATGGGESSYVELAA